MPSWQDVYHYLDPKEPLDASDKRLEKKLYINDFFNSIKEVLMLNKDRNHKLLLSGHTGCGKSTFLNLLSVEEEIKNCFHIVIYSIKDILDPNDIDHIDLLLTITIKTLASLPDKKIATCKDLEKKVIALANELKGVVEHLELENKDKKEIKGIDTSIGISLLEFFKVKFFQKYQFEKETRIEIRKHFKAKITDFLSLINSIILEVETLLNKKLLILIDDTDKIPPEKGLEIFRDNGHHIAAPITNIILVIDVSISTSSKYASIISRFNGGEFFPAIKVIEKNSTNSDKTRENRAILKDLILKRIPPEMIDEEALVDAIKLSGGVVRELIRILQYAILNAKGKIGNDNVDFAQSKLANEFNLYGKHTKILSKILADPDWLSKEKIDENEEAIVLELLHMPALFQYRNGDIKWYRPYPVFIDWIKKLFGNHDDE